MSWRKYKHEKNFFSSNRKKIKKNIGKDGNGDITTFLQNETYW